MNKEVINDRLFFILFILVAISIIIGIILLVKIESREYYYFIGNSIGKSNECYTDEYQDYYCLTDYGYVEVDQYYETYNN